MSGKAPERPWSHPFSLWEVRQGPVRLKLSPDARHREAIRKLLDLAGLESLEAELTLAPWLEGMTVRGGLQAKVTYICGVTLEPFDAQVDGEIDLRLAPQGSALVGEPQPELAIDPEGDDPPDLLEPGDSADLGAIVVEHLALVLDPFPRKPGAAFEPPADETELSPFAVLKSLKPR